MAHDKPFISVIMPTHGRADMLSRAIEAVQRSTFTDWELIIVSDGDELDVAAHKRANVDALQDDRLCFVQNTCNEGCSGARNLGLMLADGKWVAYADDDDEMSVDWLAEVHNVAQHRGTRVLLGDVYVENEGTREVRPPAIDVLRRDAIITAAFAHGRDVINDAGWWDPSFPRHADDEYINRCVRAVGLDAVYVSSVIASVNHVGHERVTTKYQSLPLTRRIHAVNPHLWWATGNRGLAVCTSLDAQRAVLAGDYHVGEFADFETLIGDPVDVLQALGKLADPVVGIVSTDNVTVWPEVLRRMSTGADFVQLPGCIAARTNAGEALARVYQAARKTGR